MKVFCEKCQGSGWIKDENGSLDVCEQCWGLGFIEVEKEANPEIGNRIRANKYSIVSMVVGMGAYYITVFMVTRNLKLNAVYTFLLIFFGYYVGVLSNSIYLHFHARHSKESKQTKSS